MMCWYKFISCNTCTTLVEDVGEGYSYVSSGCIWEISVPSFQFYYVSNYTQKNCLKTHIHTHTHTHKPYDCIYIRFKTIPWHYRMILVTFSAENWGSGWEGPRDIFFSTSHIVFLDLADSLLSLFILWWFMGLYSMIFILQFKKKKMKK